MITEIFYVITFLILFYELSIAINYKKIFNKITQINNFIKLINKGEINEIGKKQFIINNKKTILIEVFYYFWIFWGFFTSSWVFILIIFLQSIFINKIRKKYAIWLFIDSILTSIIIILILLHHYF